MKFNSTEEIEEASRELRDASIRFLETCGWEYTSDTPDNCWRCVKVIDDELQVMVSVEDAISFERALEMTRIAAGSGDD